MKGRMDERKNGQEDKQIRRKQERMGKRKNKTSVDKWTSRQKKPRLTGIWTNR
jgi:hypothetical protein